MFSEGHRGKAQCCSLELLLSVCNHPCHPSPVLPPQAHGARPLQAPHTCPVSTGPGAPLQQDVHTMPATTSCAQAGWLTTPGYRWLRRHGLRDQNPNGRNVGSGRAAPAVPHCCSTLPRCPKCSQGCAGTVGQSWSRQCRASAQRGTQGWRGHTLPQPGCGHEGRVPARASSTHPRQQHPSQGHPPPPGRPARPGAAPRSGAAPGAGRASASAGRRRGEGACPGCEGRRRREAPG